MDFGRRLKLFLFGLIIGGIMVWMIYGERLFNAGWTPSAQIKKRLIATLVKASEEAAPQLASWPSDLPAVKAAIPDADVVLNETRRKGDSLIYTLDAGLGVRQARMIFLVFEDYDRDSTATLLRVEPR